MTEEIFRDNRVFPTKFAEQRPIEFYPVRPVSEESLSADILEIGPGHGHMLEALASKRHDLKFIAIEFSAKRCSRVIKKIKRSELDNILLINGLAEMVIPRYLKLGSFGQIYVLFPDPWPKNRHAIHRLLNLNFLSILSTLLREGGDLFIATDHEAYARWVLRGSEQVPTLHNTGDPYCAQAHIEEYIPTIFEQKWRSEGRQIYYLRFERVPGGVALPTNLDFRSR